MSIINKISNPLLDGISAFLFVTALSLGLYIFAVNSTNPVNNQAFVEANKTNLYKILKPANIPPKVAECKQSLIYASNGNLSPVKCSNGNLNILAWNAISAQEPKVMRLGYSPTQSQVQSAMCSDASAANIDSSVAISAPIEETAYYLSALYYGWNFSINPATVLSSC
jgi:hypothetical protein